MMALVALLATAGGCLLLIAGAESLVRGSASLAKRMAVAEIAIGLTVVALGTSMPEMVVNIFASAQGRNEIVFGNIIGSNIFNILLILGVSGLIYPIVVQRSTVWKEIPFHSWQYWHCSSSSTIPGRQPVPRICCPGRMDWFCCYCS